MDNHFFILGKTAAKSTESLDMKDIFEERNQHLNQQCQDLAERNQFPEMLFGLKERALAWCPVPKSGTSTWITYLMELSPKSKIEKQKLYEYYKCLDSRRFEQTV